MNKKLLSLALCSVLIIGSVFSAPWSISASALEQSFSAEYNINTSARGEAISNKVSTINLWSTNSMQYAQGDTSMFDVLDHEFIDYYQIMTATGGGESIDLFIDPLDRSTKTDYDFSKILTACRTIVGLGKKPYIKLGNVPLKLSSDPVLSDYFHWNTSPPDSYEEYYTYLCAVLQALVNEFGSSAVADWRFGVFTEGENSHWFYAGDATSTKIAFYKIYDWSVKAVDTVVGSSAFVGVHFMSQTDGYWDEGDFIRHCAYGTNYATGATGSRIDGLNVSFYDYTPQYPAPSTAVQSVENVRTVAEQYGLDLIYGVDEGRIELGMGCNAGKNTNALGFRMTGYTWQGAYDAYTISSMIENDIDYFASWGYTTGGVFGTIPTISYTTADTFYNLMNGTKKLDTQTVYNGSQAYTGVSSGYNEADNSVRIMAYNMDFDPLGYNSSANMKFNISSIDGATAGSHVKVTTYRINDNCNFFDEWQADCNAAGLVPSVDFGEPSDSATVDISSTLITDKARNLWAANRSRYSGLTTLTPTVSYATVGTDGSVVLNDTVEGNTAVFYKIESDDSSATLSTDTNGNYLINNATDLTLFSALVSCGNSFSGKTVLLTADIDMKNINFTPIGSSSSQFCGIFDGCGHIIKNLTINTTENCVALFRYGGGGSIIRNVGLIDPNIFTTGLCAGGLIAQENGREISGCFIRGGSITGTQKCGGMAGSIETGTTITNCSVVDCKISSSAGTWVGGIAGLIYTGSDVNISNCYAVTEVRNEWGTMFGSILGGRNTGNCYLTNCYSTSALFSSDTNYQPTAATSCAVVSEADLTGYASTLGSAYVDDEYYQMFGYPVLTNFKGESGITQTSANKYEVSDESQLRYFSKLVENGDYFSGCTVTLTKDIVMSNSGFIPIGCVDSSNVGHQFCGIFDGNNHTITNLHINNTKSYSGLFGSTYGATIKNVGIIDPVISSTSTYSGCIVGSISRGTLLNCFVRGGSVSGSMQVGGAIGFIMEPAAITNCYVSETTVLATSSRWWCGGFVGGVSNASVTATVITNCYSTATILGDAADNAPWGGFIGGRLDPGVVTLENCYSISPYPFTTELSNLTVPAESIINCGVLDSDGIKALESNNMLGSENYINDMALANGGYPTLMNFHTHTFVDLGITQTPTCTVDGVRTQRCSVCGYEKTQAVHGGHTYIERITVEPTCTLNGTAVFTCRDCGDFYTESLDSYGHTYSAIVSNEYIFTHADLYHPAVYFYSCPRCGEHNDETFTYGSTASASLLFDNLFSLDKWSQNNQSTTVNADGCAADVDKENGTITIDVDADGKDNVDEASDRFGKYDIYTAYGNNSGYYNIAIEPNTAYTVSFNVQTTAPTVQCFAFTYTESFGNSVMSGMSTSHHAIYASGNGDKSFSFTTGSDAAFMQLRFGSCNSGNVSTTFSNIRVCKNSAPYNGVTCPSACKVYLSSECTAYGELPVPTRTDYNFAGWFTGENGTGTQVTSQTIPSGKDLQVWSAWTQNEYTVVFNGNGSTGGTMNSLPCTYGHSYNLPANLYTKTGYTFVGWSLSSDGSVVYGADASIKNLSAQSGATVELYAVWQPGTYTISYNDCGNTPFSGTFGADTPSEHTFGTATALVAPTKDGYVFGGWFTDAACTGNAITALGATDYSSNINLYAKWIIEATPPVVIGSGSTAVYGYVSDNTVSVAATPAQGHTITSYQWYSSDGRIIDGATTDTYTVPLGKPSGVYSYYCVVSSVRTDNARVSSAVSPTVVFTVSKKVVAIPAVITDIVYDGTVKTGVQDGEFYSVTGNRGTSPGTYAAVVSLDDKHNYQWSNGSSGNVRLYWTITSTTNYPTVAIRCMDGETSRKINWWEKYEDETMSLGYVLNNIDSDVRIKWSSDNRKVKIDQNGNITNTGLFSRSATITLTAYDAGNSVVAKSSVKVSFYKFSWQRSRLQSQSIVSDNILQYNLSENELELNEEKQQNPEIAVITDFIYYLLDLFKVIILYQ